MGRKDRFYVEEFEQKEPEKCPICIRELGDVNVDKHHLIPMTHGGKEKFLIHKICHRKIHATFTEKELEKKYFTWAELLTHPEIQKFVEWVKKKPIDFYDGSNETQERKGKRRR